ncbi:MAG: hypothetical protein ACOY0S_00745 [Patescibacteria group bacterium]
MFLASVFLLIVANLVFLDIVVFRQEQNAEPLSVIAPPILPLSSSTPASDCPAACGALISQQLASFVPTPTVTPSPLPLSSASAPSIKEYYIPLGIGTTKSRDWEALPAAEATIDTASYPKIKQASFEVFMHIPTGNGRVYVKLFNATDSHDVWFSEVWSEGHQITKKEVKITLDSGAKLYRVMAKSTMGYEVVVDQARIKILTN